MITIQELLYTRGLDRDARIKLVRHKDSRQDLYNLFKTDKAVYSMDQLHTYVNPEII